MLIGLDLDNTIICYDGLFHRVALQHGWIPESVTPRKQAVKAWLMKSLGNDAWTQLQGEVYGPRLDEADAYPGVTDFFERVHASGCRTCILSHKTRYPAIGPQFDLRGASLAWLGRQGWIDLKDVEFHDTREAKVAAVAQRQCEVFIDDLPEVFLESGFPAGTNKVLFDPEGALVVPSNAIAFSEWPQITRHVLSLAPSNVRLQPGS